TPSRRRARGRKAGSALRASPPSRPRRTSQPPPGGPLFNRRQRSTFRPVLTGPAPTAAPHELLLARDTKCQARDETAQNAVHADDSLDGKPCPMGSHKPPSGLHQSNTFGSDDLICRCCLSARATVPACTAHAEHLQAGCRGTEPVSLVNERE